MATSKIEVTTAFEDCAENCKSLVLGEYVCTENTTGEVYLVLRECKNAGFCKLIAKKVREEERKKRGETE